MVRQKGQTWALSCAGEPLPQCEGPKLHQFGDCQSPIEFIRILGCESSEDSGEASSGGNHGHVFEVSIGLKRYALKIFRFYDETEDKFRLIGKENDLVSLNTIRAHHDPFYNECRAYGRFIENKVNGIIAAHCYGYTTIPAERQMELYQRFKVSSWDRTEEENNAPIPKQQPLRAIVKELLLDNVSLTEKVLNKMLRDLKKMRRLGVYPMDIVARNYKSGLLIDFSLAMTKPHYMFSIKPEHQVRFIQGNDLRSFQRMINQQKFKTWQRAVPNSEYCSKLRSYKKRMKGTNL